VAERAVKQFAETVETIEKASEEAVLKSRPVKIVSGMRIMRAAGLMAIASMLKNRKLLTMDDIIPLTFTRKYTSTKSFRTMGHGIFPARWKEYPAPSENGLRNTQRRIRCCGASREGSLIRKTERCSISCAGSDGLDVASLRFRKEYGR